MKARVIETGEVIDVEIIDTANFFTKEGIYYKAFELDFDFEPDYWTKLKHQYAGMAMRGLLMNPKLCEIETANSMASTAYTIATTLIDKLKEDEQNKETQTDRR